MMTHILSMERLYDMRKITTKKNYPPKRLGVSIISTIFAKNSVNTNDYEKNNDVNVAAYLNGDGRTGAGHTVHNSCETN